MEELNTHLLPFRAFVKLYVGVIVRKNRRCRKQKMHEIDPESWCMLGFVVFMEFGGKMFPRLEIWVLERPASKSNLNWSTKTIYWVFVQPSPSEIRNPLQTFWLPVWCFEATSPILSLAAAAQLPSASEAALKLIGSSRRERKPRQQTTKRARLRGLWSIHSGSSSSQSKPTSSTNLSGS